MSKKKESDSKQIKKLCDIAQALNEKEWKDLIGSLDNTSRKKLTSALEKKSDVLKRKSIKKKDVPKSPVGKKARQKAETDNIEDKLRKIIYKFGSRKLHLTKPTKGYPTKEEENAEVAGKLELFYSHGYSGNFEESRQNIYLSPDGSLLIYFIAAVVVVYDYQNNTQKFFMKHNDDITALCMAPRSLKKPYCASGQKDPKDEPGKGKDLPKVYIWNYKTMKQIKLIDKVCWGKIHRLQWSQTGNKILYCICGDDDQTLKAWDPSSFEQKKKTPDTLIECNTLREKLLGFEINPNPQTKDVVDEILLFGKRKFCFVTVTTGKKEGKLNAKIKSVSIASFNKDSEKSFGCAQFFADGIRYAVGSQSGNVYIGKGQTCIALIKGAHAKQVGCMARFENRLITASFDKTLKEFTINEDDSGKGKEKKKETPQITEKWSSVCEVKESDFILQPRAMAINGKTNEFFIGTKTNQICRFEQKSKDSSVVVDGHDGQVWALCTHPEKNLFATGGYDNAVKLWDAKTLKCIYTFEYDTKEQECKKQEISCAAWSNNGKFVAFGSEQSDVSIFKYNDSNNSLEFQSILNIPPRSKNAEIEGVSYLRFSEDSTLLAAAHMDSYLYMYTINTDNGKLQPWNDMKHIAAPVNIQFSEKNQYCKTITRDYEIVHWKLDVEKKKGDFFPSQPDPDKVKWVDDPLIAGWDVQGLYQPGWDGTDLNDATLTNDKKLIVSGDDYGTIRLHNYPAINPSKCIEYGGHAEFVVGVEFLRDDSQLISCGGNDMAIFQWKLTKK